MSKVIKNIGCYFKYINISSVWPNPTSTMFVFHPKFMKIFFYLTSIFNRTRIPIPKMQCRRFLRSLMLGFSYISIICNTDVPIPIIPVKIRTVIFRMNVGFNCSFYCTTPSSIILLFHDMKLQRQFDREDWFGVYIPTVISFYLGEKYVATQNNRRK